MTIYNEIIQCDVYVKVVEEEVSKKQDKNTFKHVKTTSKGEFY